MESDDDFPSFSPPIESSPQVHRKRLKRLRKYSPRPLKAPLPESIDDPLFCSSVDFAELEALEKNLNFNDSNSTEETNLSQESLSQGIDTAEENGDDLEFGPDEEVKTSRKVLKFEDDVIGGTDIKEKEMEEEAEGFDQKEVDKEKVVEEHLLEEKEVHKKKKKRVKKESTGESNPKAGRSNKSREEKERKFYLKELHVESQRLLRETGDAAFKPIEVVHKPISSVLEKIRRRKLEISKKAIIVNDSSYEVKTSAAVKILDLNAFNEDEREDNVLAHVEKTAATSPNGDNHLDPSNLDGLRGVEEHTIPGSEQKSPSFNDEPAPVFRAPVDHTQDLFNYSEPNDDIVHQHVPLEEDFAPSLQSLNLNFDSAPVDDSSSDEEDIDKENIDPYLHKTADVHPSPRGDPVKHFVDDEAEEEDYSDDGLKYFQDKEEDEDAEDFEELKDMIATEYEEKPIDHEKRNELHQKWLEQQDAAGTDSLLQKLKCGSEPRETFIPDEEFESEDNDEENDEEDVEPRKSMRVNTRKAKQIILQFNDKEDIYVSDEDENAERRQAQSLLIRKEEQATLVSPADDENSREVFGLIKKLNIASNSKKRPKPSSFFDSVLHQRGNSSSSLKSSFVGRAASHPISSSHKQGSGTFRSFIFGRDDSNSRSSLSLSEDSSDTISQEIRPSKNFTAKFCNSHTKLSSHIRGTVSAETVPTTSLLEILKRSSSHSQACNQVNALDLTNGIFSFRAPKKPMKMEGRS